MRRLAKLVLLCALLTLTCACNREEKVEPSITQEDSAADVTVNTTAIAVESEFYEIIAANPIDRDFDWETDAATYARIEKAAEYTELWNAEIEHTLAILKEQLTEEDYQTLEKAHEGFEQYMEYTRDIEISVFYPDTQYVPQGSLAQPLVMETYAERTKDYALELMALEYAITGTVEFAVEK